MSSPDGRYGAVLRESSPQIKSDPPIEMDPQLTSDAEAAGRVTLAHGRFRFSMPQAVVLALITCVGGYFASAARRPPDDPSALLQEFRNENEAAKTERKKELDKLTERLGTLETKIGVLQSSIDGSNARINDLRTDILGLPRRDPMAPAMSDALRAH